VGTQTFCFISFKTWFVALLRTCLSDLLRCGHDGISRFFVRFCAGGACSCRKLPHIVRYNAFFITFSVFRADIWVRHLPFVGGAAGGRNGGFGHLEWWCVAYDRRRDYFPARFSLNALYAAVPFPPSPAISCCSAARCGGGGGASTYLQQAWGGGGAGVAVACS